MDKKAIQVRLQPQLHEQLRFLSTELNTSMNQIVVEALTAYLRQLAAMLDTQLSGTLQRLREYASSPESQEQDLRAFVAAEASLPDPAEGEVVESPPTGTLADAVSRTFAGLE